MALSLPISFVANELVTSVQKLVQLNETVQRLPNCLDTYVGENGAEISGGHRQRLGVVQAMFIKQHLLVLDEATGFLGEKWRQAFLSLFKRCVEQLQSH